MLTTWVQSPLKASCDLISLPSHPVQQCLFTPWLHFNLLSYYFKFSPILSLFYLKFLWVKDFQIVFGKTLHCKKSGWRRLIFLGGWAVAVAAVAPAYVSKVIKIFILRRCLNFFLLLFPFTTSRFFFTDIFIFLLGRKEVVISCFCFCCIIKFLFFIRGKKFGEKVGH